MFVTLELLNSYGACEEGINEFHRLYDKDLAVDGGVEATHRNLLRCRNFSFVEWLAGVINGRATDEAFDDHLNARRQVRFKTGEGPARERAFARCQRNYHRAIRNIIIEG